jgi:hypothetical protein
MAFGQILVAIVALLLALHGLVHVMGMTATWQVGPAGTVSASPGLVPAISAGTPPAKVLGVLWLIAMAGFIAASAGLLAHLPWWRPAAAAACVVSLALSIAWWSDAKAGAFIDVAILAGLVVSAWVAWPVTA